MRSGDYRLLPRIKLSLYILFVVTLFFLQNVYVHSATAAAVCLVLLFRLPFDKVNKGLLPITLFLLFTFLGNLFSSSGRILYSTALFSITDEGLQLASVRTLRLFSMIGAAKLLTATLPFEEMVASLGQMFRPLERIGVPVKDFFSVMGLTVQAFPVLSNYLVNAYREGAKNNECSGFRERITYLVSFLLPVFVRSIQSPESFFVAPESSGTTGQ